MATGTQNIMDLENFLSHLEISEAFVASHVFHLSVSESRIFFSKVSESRICFLSRGSPAKVIVLSVPSQCC